MFFLQRLSVLDRANLLNDAFSLAEAGELDYKFVLLMCKYLRQEYHSVPWEVASSKLRSIYSLLNSRETHQQTPFELVVIHQSEYYFLISLQ